MDLIDTKKLVWLSTFTFGQQRRSTRHLAHSGVNSYCIKRESQNQKQHSLELNKSNRFPEFTCWSDNLGYTVLEEQTHLLPKQMPYITLVIIMDVRCL